ncbi:hypothetical protein CEUSTIGMA_g462.t1 [Chlamydomonas eustigma]|uniref:Protein kinase domain-containing protein n=1 Tax=Chlamydomonas eustigma TaxID=1157962 RepID=A0A250WR35_9CHLO|nr:hypothetical protein CEUSTIGMA_g462.t1 [Chlamydomonas eustigma]|eukprot:GAX73010.1 hypothetical protein CEUSTIGMA_g462.t1 [Chlamydomonas eustigma]
MFKCFGVKSNLTDMQQKNNFSSASRSSPVEPSIVATGDAATHLAQLFSHASSFGSRNADMWATMQKAVEIIRVSLQAEHVSINVLSSERRCVKAICSNLSPLMDVIGKGAVCSTQNLPSVLEVATDSSPRVLQVPLGCNIDKLPSDYRILYRKAQCVKFTHVPLCFGKVLLGTLLIAKSSNGADTEFRYISAFWPFIAMYISETGAARLVDVLEVLETCNSINGLAWMVTSQLDQWFEWCHPEDTEARFVLLNEDRPLAMVFSRRNSINESPGQAGSSSQGVDLMADNILGREDSRAGATAASGRLMEESLTGTQMSLVNTLTQRCLLEGSKLLFVADVMSALKKYGEPWRDVFLDHAPVTNPCWAVAAPLSIEGKDANSPLRHVGAIIWLSNSRLNTSMLAQAIKATVPPLLQAISQKLMLLAGGLSSTTSTSPLIFTGADTDPAALREESTKLWDKVMSMCALQSSSVSVTASVTRLGISGDLSEESGVTGDYRPIRYHIAKSDSASTHSLVRAYQTAITQHLRSSNPVADPDLGAEEIEVVAKAGQGAFGSVHVAVWKGQMVAVKVMKHQEDSRWAMRTAWELAVTKSLKHPNIVFVHAVLTDVIAVKKGRKTISFIPVSTSDQESSTGDSQGGEDTKKGPGPKCQVIIMEYCNLGPMHQYVAERRFYKQMDLRGKESEMEESKDSHQKVDIPFVLAMLIEVATAVQYLHASGFIHCDLKPENILLKVTQGDGNGIIAKVSDFGMSELLSSGGPVMGDLGGTVTHIAPEIVTQKMVTKACDVYSFGIVMYEVYTCQRPYADIINSTRDKKLRNKTILTQVTQEGRRPEFPLYAPSSYVRLAQRCWAADPLQRPTFAEVVKELKSIVDRGELSESMSSAPAASVRQSGSYHTASGHSGLSLGIGRGSSTSARERL